jgi:hypothetical protein
METLENKGANKPMRIGMIVLAVLLLLALAFMIIYIIRSGRLSDENESLQSDKQILMEEYQNMKTQRDESKEETADIKSQMERMRSDFEEELRSRNAQISGLRARAHEVIELRKQVEEFKLMQADFERLQEVHDSLLLNYEELDGQYKVLTDQMQALQDSVDAVRALSAYNIYPLTKWERWLWADRYNVSQARRVDQTDITFEIAGTPFAVTGERTVYLTMLNPEGQVMYPSAETFMRTDTGEAIPYTQKQEIDFSGENVPVRFKVEHPENLDPGTYRIEVYVDGNLIRTKEINLE